MAKMSMTWPWSVTKPGRTAAICVSNYITLIGAQAATAYRLPVPTDVRMLDYYGRALEIWSSAGNRGKLRQDTSAMRTTWSRLRPQVAARGGIADVERVDAIMQRLSVAATQAAYAAAAATLLNEADGLEQRFIR